MDTSKAAAALGRKGGKAGTGEVKRRGDSAYYKALRAKRRGKWTVICGRCEYEWGADVLSGSGCCPQCGMNGDFDSHVMRLDR